MIISSELKKELLLATKQAYECYKQVVGEEKLYTFGLITDPDALNICAIANTTECLIKRAKEYQTTYNYKNSIDELTKAIRWTPGDWIIVPEVCNLYQKVNDILNENWKGFDGYIDEEEEEEESLGFCDTTEIHRICLETLKILDNRGLFGKGEAREALIITLFTTDQSDEDKLKYCKLLNSSPGLEKFQLELRESAESFCNLRH